MTCGQIAVRAGAIERPKVAGRAPTVVTGYIISDVERLRGAMRRIADFLLKAGGQRPQSKVVAFTTATKTATHG